MRGNVGRKKEKGKRNTTLSIAPITKEKEDACPIRGRQRVLQGKREGTTTGGVFSQQKGSTVHLYFLEKAGERKTATGAQSEGGEKTGASLGRRERSGSL